MNSDSRRHGVNRLKALREVTEAKAEEMAAERPRFQRLADDRNAPRVVSSFNLFQTPEPLAARLASMFPTFGRTLEPSAGLGRLYRAVRARDADCPITLVDISPECCGELYRETEGDGNAKLITGDFLTMDAARLGLFDSIIMNPPFKMGTDTRHVRQALTLLVPGGLLVSLCAAGPKQRKALGPLVETGGEWIDLPAGSFASEGTNVNAAIVVIRKNS